MDYDTLIIDDGRLVIENPRYLLDPSFFGILQCRGKRGAGRDLVYEDELFAETMGTKDLPTGYELIKMPSLSLLENPLTTEKGAKLFYFVYSAPPDNYGATVNNRLWRFIVVGVLPESPATVVELNILTDVYMNEDSLLYIVRSIAPTK